jgi:protein O-GlcNAc transferase
LQFAMLFDPTQTPEQFQAEYQRFASRFEPALPALSSFGLNRDPNRKLRIGWLSPDLRQHAVAFFMLPLFQHYPKDQFEYFAYYTHTQQDVMSTKLAGLVDRWLDCAWMNDAQLAECIRIDEIDILVDLAGHTENNRLHVLAQKPAPVQMTYLGYPGSTGLKAVDYRLTDSYANPPGTEAWYSERLLRLPHSLWCYQPHSWMPDLAPLPALSNGYITFGSFNNFNKIDHHSLALWAQLLQRIPDSQLLMVTVPEGEPRQQLLQQFEAQGISRQRLQIHGKLANDAFVGLLNQIDIALDPLNVNGATTTCEALWMGVPTLSCYGERFLTRAGLSILTAAGLPQFAVANETAFLALAEHYASHTDELASLRANLRPQLNHSALMNAAAFSQALGDLFRQSWQDWSAAA